MGSAVDAGSRPASTISAACLPCGSAGCWAGIAARSHRPDCSRRGRGVKVNDVTRLDVGPAFRRAPCAPLRFGPCRPAQPSPSRRASCRPSACSQPRPREESGGSCRQSFDLGGTKNSQLALCRRGAVVLRRWRACRSPEMEPPAHQGRGTPCSHRPPPPCPPCGRVAPPLVAAPGPGNSAMPGTRKVRDDNRHDGACAAAALPSGSVVDPHPFRDAGNAAAIEHRRRARAGRHEVRVAGDVRRQLTAGFGQAERRRVERWCRSGVSMTWAPGARPSDAACHCPGRSTRRGRRRSGALVIVGRVPPERYGGL